MLHCIKPPNGTAPTALMCFGLPMPHKESSEVIGFTGSIVGFPATVQGRRLGPVSGGSCKAIRGWNDEEFLEGGRTAGPHTGPR